MQYSVNEDGKTVINFSEAPTGKSRIYAEVTGHSASDYPILAVKYSCTKELNLAVYINGTSIAVLSYSNIVNNEGVLYLALEEDVTSLYIMVDRNGQHNPDTYTEQDSTKTVYLEFVFLSEQPSA